MFLPIHRPRGLRGFLPCPTYRFSAVLVTAVWGVSVAEADDPGTRAASSRSTANRQAAAVDGSAGDQESLPRGFHEIAEDMHRWLRREATVEPGAGHMQAVHQLCRLYVEIMQDPRLYESPTLEGYRVKIRRRLMDVSRDLERAVARARRQDERHERSDAAAGQEPDLRPEVEALAISLAMSSETLGGPAQLFSQGGIAWGGARGGGARPGDYGPDLVELIRRTISPEFWDINGGPGTIVYYPQWHALVVRATSEIHHRIGGVARGLRGD